MAAVSRVVVIRRALYRVRQSTTSTRVVCIPERLELALARAYRATDRLEQGKDYEDIFDEPDEDSRKIDPRVFIAIGSVRLWAGSRPRLLRRLLARARLSWDFRSASAIMERLGIRQPVVAALVPDVAAQRAKQLRASAGIDTWRLKWKTSPARSFGAE